jgi:hypothetical protein
MCKCSYMSALRMAAESKQSVAKETQERQIQGQVLVLAQKDIEGNMPSSEQPDGVLINIPMGPEAIITEKQQAIYNDISDAC